MTAGRNARARVVSRDRAETGDDRLTYPIVTPNAQKCQDDLTRLTASCRAAARLRQGDAARLWRLARCLAAIEALAGEVSDDDDSN